MVSFDAEPFTLGNSKPSIFPVLESSNFEDLELNTLSQHDENE